MNVVSTVVVLTSIFLLLSTLYLFFLNRSSEVLTSKLIPAAILGLVGALVTLLFSLKENRVQETTVAALIAHADKMTPLEEIHEDYHTFYGGDLFAPRSFLNPIQGQGLFDFHLNVVSAEIAHCVFGTFQALSSAPNGDLFSTSAYPRSVPKQLKRDFFTWEQYVKIFREDPVLLDTLDQFNPELFANHLMTVPSGTDITYTNSGHLRTIILRNDFVTLTITIHQWQGSRRLGEWKWILGLAEGEEDSYWVSKFLVEQEIRTNRFRSGHPRMPDQERWAKELRTRIGDNFDYDRQLRRATEYYHYFGREVARRPKDI